MVCIASGRSAVHLGVCMFVEHLQPRHLRKDVVPVLLHVLKRQLLDVELQTCARFCARYRCVEPPHEALEQAVQFALLVQAVDVRYHDAQQRLALRLVPRYDVGLDKRELRDSEPLCVAVLPPRLYVMILQSDAIFFGVSGTMTK